MSTGQFPVDPAGSPADDELTGDEVTEILARFAKRASADAPTGTIQLHGCDPVPFAGWLDLMARVEEMLGEASAERSEDAEPRGGAIT